MEPMPNIVTGKMLNSTARNATKIVLPPNYVQLLNEKMVWVMIVPIIYVAVMMVIGLIGNILVVYVYGFRWQRTPIKCFITTLAVFDLINCTITMPTEIAILVNFFSFDAHIFCKISRFSTFWMNNSSVVLLFAIAIDRFIKICMPNKKSFDYHKAKVTCTVSTIIGIVVSWPALVVYGNKTFPLPPNGQFMATQCSVADGLEKTTFPIGFYVYLWVAFLAIALVMIILYALIGAKIWMQKSKGDKRKNSLKASLRSTGSNSQANDKEISVISVKKLADVEKTNSMELSDDAFDDNATSSSDEQKKVQVQTPVKMPEKKEPRTSTSKSPLKSLSTFSRSISISKSGLQAGKATMMLFVITMVYILSFLPFLIVSILLTTRGPMWYIAMSPNSQMLVQLFMRSYLISNTGNAIVYGFGNQKFRGECRKAFKRMCRRNIR
ncbi:hypothetical protein LOTGIDRAFT_237684 [Lottia gigantea]|uniref:G-protein coupled receptors family 1 profile domain-containing protein n=1 Tax=Lottia gigantea TaxID=225164 RepID=V4BBF5_LOTGI|nr:hypothetical protein LOTGIDRAFT_237684 [Lottia gigantea]ESP03372.1 hypothetical protein LOTGIDRAFT_237684 [Lottia gigantea]